MIFGRTMRTLAVIGVLLGAAFPSIAEEATLGAELGQGPLSVRSQSPLQSLRLRIEPLAPMIVPAGTRFISASSTISNVWAVEPGEFTLDYELAEFELVFGYAVSERTILGAGVVHQIRGGGILDRFIQNFHDAVGVGQNGRDEVPTSRMLIETFDENGERVTLITEPEDASYLWVGGMHTFLHQGPGGLRMSIGAMASYEIDEWRSARNEGSRSDIGVSLGASLPLGSWVLHGSVMCVHSGLDRTGELELDNNWTSATLAAEWRRSPSFSWIAQYTLSDGLAKDDSVFADSSNEVVLGFKKVVAPGRTLEFALIENIIIHDNTPDFGVHLGYSFTY